MPANDERLFYTIPELAKRGVARATLRRLMREGEIRHRKVGRTYLLDPADIHRVFGFRVQPEEPGALSKEALDFARAMMA